MESLILYIAISDCQSPPKISQLDIGKEKRKCKILEYRKGCSVHTIYKIILFILKWIICIPNTLINCAASHYVREGLKSASFKVI